MFKKRYSKIKDERLVNLIATGDQQAFSELYARYKDRLYYYFLRMLNHCPDTANDFLQDLFMKVIQHPEYFDPSKKFSTWIFTIASNMCKNEYRRLEVRSRAHSDPACFNSDDSRKEIDEQDLLVKQLFIELDKLGNDHREVFLLYYREGFTVKEIEQILDIASGTIKSRLHYARKHLQQKLSKHQYLFLND
ncbi:RNA polymerase sigma factor [Prolixibacteraceae bacterium JC049]|nr:RNA polymerase sigma factor [Prolixibacteraceae bacterium JC049]